MLSLGLRSFLALARINPPVVPPPVTPTPASAALTPHHPGFRSPHSTSPRLPQPSLHITPASAAPTPPQLPQHPISFGSRTPTPPHRQLPQHPVPPRASCAPPHPHLRSRGPRFAPSSVQPEVLRSRGPGFLHPTPTSAPAAPDSPPAQFNPRSSASAAPASTAPSAPPPHLRFRGHRSPLVEGVSGRGSVVP
ncbi:hypothetical protein HNR10_002141 [Nocardiopsis aegyptia]|uniref:Uncharacterized protein n=1 Tax=Nocardiopsis aegyptia TaxID=220378 RepID=A0A7Z0JAB9_9ACTN|nr:hypothetical protein [Nocardiopsis aegyptia]